MKAFRYCEQCSAGLSQEQWERALFCCMCGTVIQKDSRSMPVRDGPPEMLESMVPAGAVKPLQAIQTAIVKYPVASALGSVGAGAAGLILSPLAMAAGQGLVMAGGVLLLFGLITKAEFGLKYGALLVVAGTCVYGSGYLLLGAGGVAVTAGIGLGCYSGVKAIVGMRKLKRITVKEPLLLEGGYNAG